MLFMKKWKKNLLILFVIGLISVAVVVYIATKKPVSGADSKPVAEMKADVLYAELNNNHQKFDSIYNNKNIAITGTIKEIDEATAHVFIQGVESFSINCSFDSAHFVKIKSALKIGTVTSIKGIYTGCDGFDLSANNDELDMLSGEKSAQLKTCGINQ